VPYLVPRAIPRPRRSTMLALLASVAAAALLGGCTTGPLMGDSESARAPGAERLAAGTDPEGAAATAQWAAAYLRHPQDPRMALGYARALKAIGSKDQAMEVLKVSYQTSPSGEVASELGRLALDMGRLDIAKATLQMAESQGVHDWKTLSAQGTLRAKQGQHAEAQQYFLAALELEPNAVSVTNNLALSYALDNKADRAEELLRKAMATGPEDKRIRQNLALVLGLQGKYEEARQLASIDIPAADAKANMAYLRNMLTKPTAMASLAADGPDEVDAVPGAAGQDWEPFAANTPAKGAKPVASAAAVQAKPTAKAVHVAQAPQATPVAQDPQPAAAPAATSARVATLLPGESGSSTVAKSSPGRATNADAKGAQPAASTLLRTNVE
jgi:Flp pilus assembly protein TadD